MDLLRNGSNICHIYRVIVDKFLLKADVFGGPIQLRELFVEKEREKVLRALFDSTSLRFPPKQQKQIYDAKQRWNKTELLEWKDQGGKEGLNTKEHTKQKKTINLSVK